VGARVEVPVLQDTYKLRAFSTRYSARQMMLLNMFSPQILSVFLYHSAFFEIQKVVIASGE